MSNNILFPDHPYLQTVTSENHLTTDIPREDTTLGELEFLVLRCISGYTRAANKEGKVIFEKVKRCTNPKKGEMMFSFMGEVRAFDRYEATIVLVPGISLTVWIHDEKTNYKGYYFMDSLVVLNACLYLMKKFHPDDCEEYDYQEVPKTLSQHWFMNHPKLAKDGTDMWGDLMIPSNHYRFKNNREHVSVFFLLEASRLGLLPDTGKIEKLKVHGEKFRNTVISYDEIEIDGAEYSSVMRRLIWFCL